MPDSDSLESDVDNKDTPSLISPDPPVEGWRDIESVPLDGTIVDVWLGDGDAEDVEFYCAPGSRRGADWHWRQGRMRPYLGLGLPVVTVRPTHWRHRPAPPVLKKDAQEEGQS
jgi:hypothetical protein